MKITFLGTGTCHQQAERSTAAVDCSGWGTHFLVDIGSGTMRRLREAEIDPTTIEAVFLTHQHADHISDLVPLLHMFINEYPKPRRRTLYIFGPTGIERVIWTLLQTMLPEDYDSLPFRLDIREISDSEIDFGKIKVQSLTMEHVKSMATVGFRFGYKGKSFAVSGDSGMCKALYKLGQGADLYIIEANNPNSLSAPNHLTPAEAAAIGNKAKVKELVLTHISPLCQKEDLQSGAKIFSGRLTVAEDFMEMKI